MAPAIHADPARRRAVSAGAPRPGQKLAPAAGARDDRAMDWDSAIAAFARYLEVERAYSPRTVEVYLRDVRALRAHLVGARGHERPLDRLAPLDVRGQLAALYGANGAATIGRKLSSVRAFGRFLVKRGVLAANPAAAIRDRSRCSSTKSATNRAMCSAGSQSSSDGGNNNP